MLLVTTFIFQCELLQVQTMMRLCFVDLGIRGSGFQVFRFSFRSPRFKEKFSSGASRRRCTYSHFKLVDRGCLVDPCLGF